MDTGAYMANQMDDQIERGLVQMDLFYEWIDKILELRKASGIYPNVDIADAKLSFLDGVSAEEYSKTINV